MPSMDWCVNRLHRRPPITLESRIGSGPPRALNPPQIRWPSRPSHALRENSRARHLHGEWIPWANYAPRGREFIYRLHSRWSTTAVGVRYRQQQVQVCFSTSSFVGCFGSAVVLVLLSIHQYSTSSGSGLPSSDSIRIKSKNLMRILRPTLHM
jgi:hypothetical protein